VAQVFQRCFKVPFPFQSMEEPIGMGSYHLHDDSEKAAEGFMPSPHCLKTLESAAAQRGREMPASGHVLATPDPFTRVRRREPSAVSSMSSVRVSRHLMEFGSDLSSWVVACSAALPLFLLSYSSCVTYAQLIVTGSPVNANIVTAMNLVSCGLTGIVLPLRSQCPLIIPSVDITVTLFYACVVQDVVKRAASVVGGLSEEEVAATAAMALPVNTILMSLAVWWVGRKKATVVVSYLPYPVVAGFLGSIGWAIFAGSFAVLSVSGESISTPTGLSKLAQERPFQLLCAITMALAALLLRSCRIPPRIVAVAPMTLAFIAFWCWVLISQCPLDEFRRTGWLFPATWQQPFWEVWTGQSPELVHWPAVIAHPSTFAGLGMVLVLSLTLRISGIEGSTGMVIDVDEEVKWTGIASAAAGLCGATIGSHSPGLTTFNQEAGSKDVRPALLTAVLQLALWLSGFPAMNFLPRFMLAGILMNLGLVMLLEWMWMARHKVGRLGLLVIYTQVVSSAVLGLLPSVLIGVAAACGTAQAQLMTLHVLKFHVSGKSVSSYVRRTEADRIKLSFNNDKIEALGLEGHLAEGPMIKFSNYVRKYTKQNSQVRHMIFDFRFVQGTNASACALLAKLDKTLEEQAIRAVYTNIGSKLSYMLQSFGISCSKIYDVDAESTSSFQVALKDCEDMVLGGAAPLGLECDRKFSRSSSYAVEDAELDEGTYIARLAGFLSCEEEQIRMLVASGRWSRLPPGHVLARQGSRTGTLHISVPGFSEVTEMIDVGQSIGPAHQVSVDCFGVVCAAECVLYDEVARSTFIISTKRSVLLSVDRDVITELASRDPGLHGRLATLTAKQLLRRCDALSQAVELNKGGGWRGAAFDRHTAQICANLWRRQGDHDDSSKGRIVKRRMLAKTTTSPALQRRDSIMMWASRWLDQRPDSESVADQMGHAATIR